MRKLLFLLPILLLTSCASLDFQIRTLHTANMYDGIYYNTPTRVNSNFIFFQPNYHNDFWWNYSQTFPYNWNHFSSFGLTYNWRYNRWNSNQWLINPYYNQFRIAPLYTPIIIRNRGRRSNTAITTPNRNYVRVKGRRGSSNTQIRQPRTNTTSVDRVIRKVNEGRRIIPTPNSRNRVIERPQRRIQSPPTRTRTQIRTPQRTRSNNSSSKTQVRVNSGRRSIKQ